MDRLTSYIHGETHTHGGQARPLKSPIDLRVIGELVETPLDVVEKATSEARAAYEANKSLPVAERIQWLAKCADAIEANAAALTELIIEDVGKPRRAAGFEVGRAAQFVRAVVHQAATLTTDTVPLDTVAGGAGRFGFTRRVPYGVVAAITPFNAPINLLVQKVAPALAMGNAVVVKPHPAGTRVALAVARFFTEAGLPAGLFNVITGDREAAAALAADPKVSVVTFTGGTEGGAALIRAAGAKKFIAELGSNSANVVLDDADIEDAASRIAAAAFEASGQQCVSAQRIIVDQAVYDEFLAAFTQAAKKLRTGDPYDQATDVGPMVSLEQAERVMAMAAETIKHGARYALEPTQQGCIVSPGILVDVPQQSVLWQKEVFGPLAVVTPASDPEHALRLANDSPFGLQGSVFTRDIARAFRFADEFDVGALWVNEASRFRLDMYAFGGSKQSGFGREGVRYALEELSQLKFIGIRPVAKPDSV